MIPVNFTELPLTPLLLEAEDEETEVFVPLIKAVFKIGADGRLTPKPFDEQPEIAGPVDYDDEIGRGPRHDDDMVHWKPNVDVMFNAVCHPPGNRSVSACRVAVGIEGLFRRELVVFGPRTWQWNDFGEWYISGNGPVEVTPLRWEYSFGGLEHDGNTYGQGVGADPFSDPEDPVYSLPRIEDPNNLIRFPNDQPAPVNFGPIPEYWPQRDAKLGTRDIKWQVFVSPKPPKDYDPTFLNAAPDDQQVAKLRGNETIILENLHPEHPVFRIQLPDIRPRVFYVFDGDEERTLHDIAMPLDTVRVDMEAGEVTLLWRGYWEHGFEDLEKNLDYLHIVEEKASERKKPASDYHPAFLEAIPDYEEALKLANLTPEEVEKTYFADAQTKIAAAFKEAGMPESDAAAVEEAQDAESLQKTLEGLVDSKLTDLRSQIDGIKRQHGID